MHNEENEKYHRYLASREWALKKERVKKRSSGICERCKINKSSCVHHLTYIRKYNENLSDLQDLCNACHEFIHGKTDLDPKPILLNGRKVKSVYLAGKITNTTWRDDLCCQNDEGKWSGYNHGRIIQEGWSGDAGWGSDGHWVTVNNVLQIANNKTLDLTGPFWKANDSTGGLCGGHGTIDMVGGLHACGNINDSGNEATTDPNEVIKNCKTAIFNCDLFFAWIDSFDCYGTLCEIGFARALNKIIAIGLKNDMDNINDLWFANALADITIKGEDLISIWEELWSGKYCNKATNHFRSPIKSIYKYPYHVEKEEEDNIQILDQLVIE